MSFDLFFLCGVVICVVIYTVNKWHEVRMAEVERDREAIAAGMNPWQRKEPGGPY